MTRDGSDVSLIGAALTLTVVLALLVSFALRAPEPIDTAGLLTVPLDRFEARYAPRPAPLVFENPSADELWRVEDVGRHWRVVLGPSCRAVFKDPDPNAFLVFCGDVDEVP